MNQKIVKILESKVYKKIAFTLSTLFLLFTIFIAFRPEPFLRLGYFGIFFFNMFSSGLFLLPSIVGKMNLIGISFVSALGMSFNESINWIMGSSSSVVLKQTKFEKKVEEMIQKYETMTIFFLALIPFPFDIVGIIAGRLNIPYTRFILPVFVARLLRFFIAGLIVLKVSLSFVN